jgi:molybdenum cofactor guanylyltransferase
MGTDKALLRVSGTTLLERAIATTKQVFDEVVLVGDKKRLAPFGLVLEDVFAGQGPLAGIQAALTSGFAKELNLIVSVDVPGISAELLRYLLAEAERTEATVTVPRVAGHLQTLCAIYRPAFAALAESALREQKNRIDPLFSQIPLRIIEEAELCSTGFLPDIFDNINTPADWERFRQRFETETK